MAPDLKKRDLLYLSDAGNGSVYVYSYPDAQLQGTLTGLSFPAGECVDKAGNIWIVEEGPDDIVEYAHGGTTPIATLTDADNAPEGCSVDPTTGNLAVANSQTLSAGPGSVAVYANARGIPTLYPDSQMKFVLFVAYDDKGNLYADGVDSSLAYQLAELRRGAAELTPIAFSQSIVEGGNIQWDGKYLAVGDGGAGGSGTPIIYHVKITHSEGKVAGATPLTGTRGLFQFFIQGNTFIGPNLGDENVLFWKYPAGGTPTKAIGGFSDPFGSAVSIGKKDRWVRARNTDNFQAGTYERL
jgi:DNA-binding beta-propeller fold protein YncE